MILTLLLQYGPKRAAAIVTFVFLALIGFVLPKITLVNKFPIAPNIECPNSKSAA
jgi:hypothetical protein